MPPPLDLTPEYSAQTYLADFAISKPGASRVFHRHGLDFCCNGHVSLEEACRNSGLDASEVLEELRKEEQRPDVSFSRWDEEPLPVLIKHLIENFHEPHREELERLYQMALKVEMVHGDKPECPKGLADHIQFVTGELQAHMDKEEQVLFPLILAGQGSLATAPVQAMEEEHKDHGKNLERLRELAHGYQPPEEACGTWTALYLGLEQFERDIMDHISLENNALFPRALRG